MRRKIVKKSAVSGYRSSRRCQDIVARSRNQNQTKLGTNNLGFVHGVVSGGGRGGRGGRAAVEQPQRRVARRSIVVVDRRPFDPRPLRRPHVGQEQHHTLESRLAAALAPVVKLHHSVPVTGNSIITYSLQASRSARSSLRTPTVYVCRTIIILC